MAKDRNRGNREAKKPKATKKPAASTNTSFIKPSADNLPKKTSGK